MESGEQHLVRMANQIATFFNAQPADAPASAAQSVAGHLKLFWAPSMRRQLVDAFQAGRLEGLEAPVVAALRDHGAELVLPARRTADPAGETYPQGGGDAG